MITRLSSFFSISSFGVLFYFTLSIFHSIFERLLDFASVIWCYLQRLLIPLILPDNLTLNSTVLEIPHLCFVSDASQRQSTVTCGEQGTGPEILRPPTYVVSFLLSSFPKVVASGFFFFFFKLVLLQGFVFQLDWWCQAFTAFQFLSLEARNFK